MEYEQVLKLIAKEKKYKTGILDLSYDNIPHVLKEILEITWLTELYLRSNQINNINFLSTFTNLRYLLLRSYQINDYSSLSVLTNLHYLHLKSNQISNISFLLGLTNLQYLYLSDNQIKNTSFLAGLTNLRSLDLSNNQISDISFLTGLINLQELDLSNNQINDISFLTGLTNLRSLDLSNNQISDINPLKSQIIDYGLDVSFEGAINSVVLKENPLTTPPPEIAKRGRTAVVNYFKEMEEGRDYLHEAKLIIVGEAGAGKTTLYRKLKDIDAPLPNESETTQGIDIHRYDFPINDKDINKFTVNVWDFGGQEIYHATHQFFLTKRSLYILVSDVRKEDTDFNYWLELIELLSDKSPVIILQNQKGGRKIDFDQRGLSGRFGNILLPVFSLNLKKDKSKLKKLKQFINFHIQQLAHVGQELPEKWISVRQELEQLEKEKPFINWDEYYKICEKNGMSELERAKQLSGYLHDLGVFLHFQDDAVLSHTVILQNEWATNAVYSILDDDIIKFEKKGNFCLDDLKRILTDDNYNNMHFSVLQLMMNFELCYPITHNNETVEYIAPQLLSIKQPKYYWDNSDNLQLRYQYEFMPKGLISQFIVRLHRYAINQNEIWRSGVILYRNRTKAEVIETYGRRSIRIRVKGNHKKELLTIIAEEIDFMNKAYKDLRYKKLVPCNCRLCKLADDPHFYDYADLLKRKENNKQTVECPKSYKFVNVTELIDDVFVQRNTVKKVFISYAREDEVFKEKIKDHFSSLIRSKEIVVWDDKKLHSGKWNPQIESQLNQSDIILFLVSKDFISIKKKYIWEKEIPIAVNRSRNDAAVELIPIVLKPCDWEETPLGDFTALPEKAKPISTWDDENKAFLAVVRKIKMIIRKNKYYVENSIT